MEILKSNLVCSELHCKPRPEQITLLAMKSTVFEVFWKRLKKSTVPRNECQLYCQLFLTLDSSCFICIQFMQNCLNLIKMFRIKNCSFYPGTPTFNNGLWWQWKGRMCVFPQLGSRRRLFEYPLHRRNKSICRRMKITN